MEQTLPVVLRAAERCFICGGGVLLVLLGYSLFVLGMSKGSGKLEAKSRLGAIVLSGSGPGLFFMAFGAIVLIVGLLKGGVRVVEGIDPNS